MFRHLFAPSLACLAVIGATGAAAAEAVVMASTASGYEIGRMLADGESVSLPEGASLHVLEASGRVVSLTGPFEGPLDAVARDSRPVSIAGLWAGGTFSQADLGAARSLVPPGNSVPDLLAVDLGRPGRHCIVDGIAPNLRASPDTTVTDRGSARAIRLNAPPSGGPMPAPPDLPLAKGTVLDVSPAGRAPYEIELRRIDAPPDDVAALAVGLAREGCAAQAGALLDRLRDAVVPLELHVDSERGAYPTYERGEAVRLTLRTSRDAHLLCQLRDARGTAVPIFPSAASGGSLLKAGETLTFPGGRMPLPLNADGQTVHCFASERDLTADLGTGGQDFVALGRDGVARLDRILNEAATLATAHIVLRTE